MAITKVFQSNRLQAVRLPRAVEFPPDVRDVAIRRVGRSRIISPANALWDDFFEGPAVDLGQREQLPMQERDSL